MKKRDNRRAKLSLETQNVRLIQIYQIIESNNINIGSPDVQFLLKRTRYNQRLQSLEIVIFIVKARQRPPQLTSVH